MPWKIGAHITDFEAELVADHPRRGLAGGAIGSPKRRSLRASVGSLAGGPQKPVMCPPISVGPENSMVSPISTRKTVWCPRFSYLTMVTLPVEVARPEVTLRV
jgi:hypothetical protein